MIDEMEYKPLEKNVIKRPTNCFAQLQAKLTQHIRFTSEPIIIVPKRQWGMGSWCPQYLGGG